MKLTNRPRLPHHKTYGDPTEKDQHTRPFSTILWHPHQRLWNWDLVRAIRKTVPLSSLRSLIVRTIILLDTLLLFLSAVARRASLLGLSTIFSKTRVPHGISILYFDFGTHKEAEELTWMVNKVLPRLTRKFHVYGFEASKESFEQARKKLAHLKTVNLFHKALCNLDAPDSRIKLYKDMRRGLGDSLYRRSDSYEEVEAVRFSDWLREHNIALENIICLLRMNIEGAEYDVLKDLVARDLASRIDGFYGMWDDLSKIDKARDREFLTFLAAHNIHPFTFNGRDLEWRLRLRCIEYDINTSVRLGLRKLGHGHSASRKVEPGL